MKSVGVAGDPNLAAVQSALVALGDLRDAVVLVGGCATGLLLYLLTVSLLSRHSALVCQRLWQGADAPV